MVLANIHACSPETGLDSSLLETDTDGLPSRSDAALLLAMLSDDGISVEGSVSGQFYVDTDHVQDQQEGFRYQVLDSDSELLFESSTRGPVIVRDFLDYYSDMAGLDILSIYPELGAFPVMVPLLDGAETVRFQVRDEAGEYQDQGEYQLSDVQGDDVGLSEVVVDWETLHQSGASSNRLDIVLTGDGYTENEMATWYADAQALADEILSTEPMADFAGHINIHRVDAVSAESGASYDCVDDCRFKDTAYGSVFAVEMVNQLMNTNYRTEAVFQMDQWEVARAVSVVPWDLVIVVVNTEHDGGMAIHYATVSTAQDDNWAATGVHEMAHVLGLLGDEYMGDVCLYNESLGLPGNITDDPEDPPWPLWIEDGTPLPTPDQLEYYDLVGAFQGAYNCSFLYRPAHTCRMRASGREDFCPVCAEILARWIFHFADPTDDIAIQDDGDLVTLQPVTQAEGILYDWYVDDQLEASTTNEQPFVLDAAAWGDGQHSVALHAQLPTDWVRDDQGDLQEDWSWTWTP